MTTTTLPAAHLQRYAARSLSEALRDLDKALAEIDARDWWDGPPYSLEQDRDLAADRVVLAVEAIMGGE